MKPKKAQKTVKTRIKPLLDSPIVERPSKMPRNRGYEAADALFHALDEEFPDPCEFQRAIEAAQYILKTRLSVRTASVFGF